MAKQNDGPQPAAMAMIGLQVAVGVAVGYFVGRWLDRRYGWSPNGVIVGPMIGLAGGLYLLIRESIRINKD